MPAPLVGGVAPSAARVMSTRQRRHRDAVVELLLRGEEQLELGLAARQLGLEAHDASRSSAWSRARGRARRWPARWRCGCRGRRAARSTSSASWSKRRPRSPSSSSAVDDGGPSASGGTSSVSEAWPPPSPDVTSSPPGSSPSSRVGDVADATRPPAAATAVATWSTAPRTSSACSRRWASIASCCASSGRMRPPTGRRVARAGREPVSGDLLAAGRLPAAAPARRRRPTATPRPRPRRRRPRRVRCPRPRRRPAPRSRPPARAGDRRRSPPSGRGWCGVVCSPWRSDVPRPARFPCHTRSLVPYDRDILDELADAAPGADATRRSTSPPGMVVEDRASGFCGDVVQVVDRGGDAARPHASTSATSRGSRAASCSRAGRSRCAGRRRRRPAAPAVTRRGSVAGAAPRRPGRRRQPDLGRGPPRRRAGRARVGRRPARRSASSSSRCTASTTSPPRWPAFGPSPRAPARRARRPPRRRVEGVAAGRGRARSARAGHRAPVRRRVGRRAARGCSGSTAGPTCPGRPWKEGVVPRPRRRPSTASGPGCATGADLRRPAPRAGRRRRAAPRLRRAPDRLSASRQPVRSPRDRRGRRRRRPAASVSRLGSRRAPRGRRMRARSSQDRADRRRAAQPLHGADVAGTDVVGGVDRRGAAQPPRLARHGELDRARPDRRGQP